MNYKTCTKCRECKPEHQFYYEKRAAKHLARCKTCVIAYLHTRKDKAKAYSQAHYQKKKANGYKAPTYEEKTHKRKQDAARAVKKWRANNKEKFNHEAKLSIRLRRSQAYKEHWLGIIAHYGNKCLCCKSTSRPLCFDHVRPLSQGGANDVTNGQPLCRKCNTFKGQVEPTKDYRPDHGRYAWELMGNEWIEVERGEDAGFTVYKCDQPSFTAEQIARQRIIDGIIASGQ